MRLAFCLFKYFPHGGLQRDFLQVAKACVQQGHKVHVFTLAWQGEQPEGLSVTVLSGKGLTNHQRCWNFAQHLQGYLAGFDRVIGFNKMPGLDVYYAADNCYRARLKQYNWLTRLNPRYKTYLKMEAAVFNPSSRTYCLLLTQQQQAEFQQYYHTPSARLHLLPPNISSNFIPLTTQHKIRKTLRREWAIAEDEYLILMVASYFYTKGVDRAITAMAALPPGIRVKTHLVIVGQDRTKSYQRKAQRLKLNAQVQFLGGRDDVNRCMWAADLLLHPARLEAGGKVLLEAMTAGLPILTVANCGYANHVTQAKAGTVLPLPFAQAALNQQLIALLAQPELLQEYHERALHYSAQADWFSMPQQAVKWIEQC